MAPVQKIFESKLLKEGRYAGAARLLLSSVVGESATVSTEVKLFYCRKLIQMGVLLALPLLSACLPQVAPVRSKNVSSAIQFNGQGPRLDAVRVAKVLRTQMSPNLSIDLIGGAALGEAGESTGALETFCRGSPSASTSNRGDNEDFKCACVFRYKTFVSSDSTSGATANPIRAITEIEKAYNPIYVEADLVRCPVPSDIDFNDFQIFLRNNQGILAERSNITHFYSIPKYDLNDPTFFTDVERHVCRNTMDIPHLMNSKRENSGELTGNMIDPLQYNSDQTAYHRIFYTTNRGLALAEFSQIGSASQRGIHCEPHLHPNKRSLRMFVTETPTSEPVLISTADGQTASGIDRINFSVASKEAGPFTAPVFIQQAPGVTPRPLGFAAIPDPRTELCPSTTPPAGMKWKKIWLFQGAMKPRSYYRSFGLENTSMRCMPGQSGGRFAKTSPVLFSNPNVTPSSYFMAPDCGNSGPEVRDVGLNNCATPATGPLRLLQYRAGSNTDRNYHRCIQPDTNLGAWKSACSTSSYASRNEYPFANPSPNLGLLTYTADRYPIETPVHFLFLVTPPETSASAVATMKLIIPFDRSSTLTADNFDRFDLVTNPSESNFQYPLCVLQREGL